MSVEGTINIPPLRSPVACPDCYSGLDVNKAGAICRACSATYPVLDGGYVNLMPPSSTISLTPSAEYLAEQIEAGANRAERWLARQMRPGDRYALDVGCGTGSIGKIIAELHPTVEVWGVDLPDNLPGWQCAGADPQRVIAGSALDLPFESNRFDLVWSIGVIEHIGEPKPPAERAADRLRYIDEILRVLRPGGRAIVVAPHKWFPIDPAHDFSSSQILHRVYERFHLGVHQTWGPHPLMSFREVWRLAHSAGARKIRPLSMADYFSFAHLGSGRAARLVPAARFYLNHLPGWMGATPLAPYLAVELTRV
ncbi:class I SAM-dependent methyltransferase [Mycobacterium sp. SM3041]|uniref:class I SAM-dependent methyltransferase n=1 Tax=Mycobacterium sp. SM3041 TaxID=3114291 RepID=UPI003204FC31